MINLNEITYEQSIELYKILRGDVLNQLKGMRHHKVPVKYIKAAQCGLYYARVHVRDQLRFDVMEDTKP